MTANTPRKKQKVIAITGATATGKTALAIATAKKINGEIISADSRLVYKEYDIATAKPTIEERQGIKHYLIDVVEPEYDFSVADFCDMAKNAIREIASKGKTPIIAGGTGLYFRILLEDYDLPRVEANPEYRAKLEEYSCEELYKRLQKIDAKSAEKIHYNNKVKIIRALEVANATGKPMSEIAGKKEPEFDVEWIGLNFHNRELLYERVDKRVDIMLEKGLLKETETLLKKHGRIPTLLNTIGYQELIEYLDKKTDFEEAVKLIKQNSRHYAKRQITWFRRNPLINWKFLDD